MKSILNNFVTYNNKKISVQIGIECLLADFELWRMDDKIRYDEYDFYTDLLESILKEDWSGEDE